ncbi:Endonuclease/exonuclease/phosphatase [Elsinoe ampelina]|uniref:Endonuclease/exonuclease/phosphatase n=1 Tax=Elsinoe ampelina TaxID=302913 RepID=A0A6A6G9B3_9PEZI|nr:Endonuclease/exonuclease/phosphatase [Elsinoe ampelina]
MTDLDCCVVTFNCARELVDSKFFANSLNDALSKGTDPPDFLVLALQELAPIAYAFIGSTYLAPYFSRFTDAVDTLVDLLPGTTIRYELVQTLNAGMTGIMVFAQPDIARNITSIETAAVRVGSYELGNKGAVGVRVHYTAGNGPSSALSFVGAHLAPHEDAWQRRNQDWATIASNMIFTPSSSIPAKRKAPSSSAESQPLLSGSSTTSTTSLLARSLSSPNTSLFLAGDLNYRTTDLRPHPEDYASWPSPFDSLSNDPQDPSSPFASLFKTDQLTRELKAQNTLHGLHEETVHFAPTYKYSDSAIAFVHGSKGASSSDPASSTSAEARTGMDKAEKNKVWASHRAPSWCDRILYRAAKGTKVKGTQYDSLELQPMSDHRPVVGRFTVSASQGQREEESEERVRHSIDPDWEARRTRSARKDLVVGIGAYLVTTWEGRLAVVGMLAAALGAGAVAKSYGY